MADRAGGVLHLGVLHLGAEIATHLACMIAAAAVVSSATAAETLSIRSRFDKTFALHGGGAALQPGPVRGSPAGTREPGPGEMMVSISSTYAVGLPKLHVYNRTPTAVMIKAEAMKGATRLAKVDLCGHLDTDSWVVLPAHTSSVIVSQFVAVKGECP